MVTPRESSFLIARSAVGAVKRHATLCSLATRQNAPASGVPTGYSPLFALPGTGEYEWTGDLDSRYIPFDQDPTRGWIGTARMWCVPVPPTWSVMSVIDE